MINKMHSPQTAAELILINVVLYGNEREKEITRYRFSATTFKRIAGRKRLKEGFIESVEDALFECGWYLMRIDEITFAVIKTSSVDNWASLSAKRVIEWRNSDEDSIRKKYTDLFPDNEELPDGE